MAWTYEEVNPTLIVNTTMEKGLNDGIHKIYRITPNEGYVMHDKTYDDVVLDEETGDLITVGLGYRRSTASVSANYDFAANPREFYTVLESEVPEDQIHGGGTTPDTEIM